MRIKKQWNFDTSIEIEEGYTGRYGAPGKPREKKRKPTPEEIRRQNQRNRENNMRRLIKANFGKYDCWETITYRKGDRPTLEEMKADMQRLIRKVRKEYRKRGHELKYILRMEIGKRGGPHIHILVNAISGTDYRTEVILSQCWDKGHVNSKTLYESGGYKELADYIVKEQQEWEPESLKRYTRSRNLEVPKPKVRKWKARSWREPKAPAGWYIDKETFFEGTNPFTGKTYRHYIMYPLKGGSG